jgi:NADH:ubiquinone oxidoreductase subunit 2 (subunit N)
MSRSGLYSPIMGTTQKLFHKDTPVPFFANATGSVITVMITSMLWYFEVHIYQCCYTAVLLNSVAYILTFASFIVVRSFFKDNQKTYKSYTGFMGAVFGIILFLSLIIIIILRGENEGLTIFCSIIGASIVFYILVAYKRQKLSPEEANELMIVHVIKSKFLLQLKFQSNQLL